jgi:hypothetical protein
MNESPVSINSNVDNISVYRLEIAFKLEGEGDRARMCPCSILEINPFYFFRQITFKRHPLGLFDAAFSAL